MAEGIRGVANGEFAFTGTGAWELGVVGAGADGDAEADGDVVEQQGAIGGGGGDVHSCAETGLREDVANVAVGAGLLAAEHERMPDDVREGDAARGCERMVVRADELEWIAGERPEV